MIPVTLLQPLNCLSQGRAPMASHGSPLRLDHVRWRDELNGGSSLPMRTISGLRNRPGLKRYGELDILIRTDWILLLAAASDTHLLAWCHTRSHCVSRYGYNPA